MQELKKGEVWYCEKCGYTSREKEPPYTCPICYAPKDDFIIKNQDEVTGY